MANDKVNSLFAKIDEFQSISVEIDKLENRQKELKYELCENTVLFKRDNIKARLYFSRGHELMFSLKVPTPLGSQEVTLHKDEFIDFVKWIRSEATPDEALSDLDLTLMAEETLIRSE